MEMFDALATVLAADREPLVGVGLRKVEELIAAAGGHIIERDDEVFIALFGIGDERANLEAVVRNALTLRAISGNAPAARPLRVGIATGVVTIRIEADGRHYAEGDAIQLAVALRGQVASGGVATDADTYHEIQHLYTARVARPVGVKGASQPLEAHILDEHPERPPPIGSLNKVYGSMFDAMRTGGQPSDVSLPQAIPSIPKTATQIVVGSQFSGVAGDRVDCTVFAPPSVGRGESFFVQVFAHVPSEAADAARAASEFDSTAARRAFRSLESNVTRGARLAFELAMPGLEVDDASQSFVWNGRTESAQFGVTVPAGFTKSVIIATVIVSQNTVPVGHLKFRLEIASVPGATKAEPVGDSACRYNRAFISYASRDRDKVLSRVQMLKPLGIEFFQDILDLEPGDRWEKELYRHIDESDLFLLFWSTAARESKWVMEEVKYALARKQGDDFAPPEIRPVIIEGPPVPPPPPELAHLHFNDRLIYFVSDSAA
jgi:hypothetical protein